MTVKLKKKQKLRNNEYYDIQEMFDDLYDKSKNKSNYKFYKLMDLITDERNIKLAYRNIKKNTGSKTSGTNGHTIEDIANLTNDDIVGYVRNRLRNYHPHQVRRVEIPKGDGRTRPLGIPTIEDRLIQQCIKQVLEPICEGKFYNHSYGFRPNRSTEHAIARSYHLIQRNNLHYVVDIDIKGFFDNVNHGKLLKQMWAIGIRDKQLLSIISKMLKAPIKGIGKPDKGTPQGGILSPLLSNIVLNELDWWIASQWELFKTHTNYDYIDRRNGSVHRSYRYTVQRKTKLKEIYIVRYADDFKLFCSDYNSAKKIHHATKTWLKERLHLEISEEKSKIVNLKKDYSEFLGIKMKLKDKNGKKIVKSNVTDKAKNKIIDGLREQIKSLKRDPSAENILRYNSLVLGTHNYYKIASCVNIDFNEIGYKTLKCLKNRTKNIRTNTGYASKGYDKYYGNYSGRMYIREIAIYPIWGIKTKPPMNFTQEICNYTEKGRTLIHKKLQNVSMRTLKYIMENPIPNRSLEYNDNRISLYVGQNGLCPISKEILMIGNMECHHKTPLSNGGSDEYSNLILVCSNVHKLIHAKENETINKYLEKLTLTTKSKKDLNKLRILAGNFEIQ